MIAFIFEVHPAPGRGPARLRHHERAEAPEDSREETDHR
jgi:hypothetical protein